MNYIYFEAIGNDENEHKAFAAGVTAKTVMDHLENATMAVLEDMNCTINIFTNIG
jgi:hypothetical protein